MNDLTRLAPPTLSIAAVERDTGLSKDTLRVWERRYGFPSPARDALGERAYSAEQVEKLRVIKRLLDGGQRPGRIVPLSHPELLALGATAPADTGPAPAADTPPLQAQLALIRDHDTRRLRSELSRLLSRLGVARFVSEVIAPLNIAVGDAWLRGQMEIFEEHAYTEVAQVVLRQAIASLPEHASGAPRVLLATLPGEPHGLGLLMAEAMFALEGCECVSLGVQTPLWDVALAATAYDVGLVALSFSGCLNPNQVVDSLTELRRKLPPAVAIWAGGTAPVLHRRQVDGVLPMASLQALPAELRRLRARGG